MSNAQTMRGGARSSRWLGPRSTLNRQLRDFWRRLRAGWVRRRIERDAWAELRGLDSRMLRDIGIEQDRMPWIARAVAEHGRAVHVAASRGIDAEG